jgi:hypothetical protein
LPFAVTGKRLDARTPQFATGSSHAVVDYPTYMMTGIDIPALGCWKISGKFEDAELSFVVWVTQ